MVGNQRASTTSLGGLPPAAGPDIGPSSDKARYVTIAQLEK